MPEGPELIFVHCSLCGEWYPASEHHICTLPLSEEPEEETIQDEEEN